MASPITWQNVQGRSLAEAAIPMQAASQSILGGFDRLGKVFDQYQSMEQKKLDLADEANVQGFLDRLQRAGSPEEVAALQASGELDTLRAGIGTKNLARVRGAEDSRVAGLMQQMGAQQKFGDDQLARERVPAIAKANEFIANNDEAGLKAYLATVDLGDESKFIQQMYNTGRARTTDARTDELAPLTHKNAIVAAEEAQRVQAEKETSRRLEATIAEALTQRSTDEVPKLGAFPKVVGFSPAQSGVTLPAPTTVEEAEALNESILRGGTGITPPRTSDTASADAFVRRLRESNKFTPEFIEKNLASIRSSFDSTGREGRVGNDAASAALDRAKERVEFDEKMKNNWSAPGTADVKNSYEALAKEVPALIDKTTGTSIDEDIPYIQEKLSELSVKGIEIAPGKFVTPSINEVRAALRTAEGGNGWLAQGDKYRGNDFMKRLTEMMKNTNVAARIKEAEELQQTARKFAVQEIINGKK